MNDGSKESPLWGVPFSFHVMLASFGLGLFSGAIICQSKPTFQSNVGPWPFIPSPSLRPSTASGPASAWGVSPRIFPNHPRSSCPFVSLPLQSPQGTKWWDPHLTWVFSMIWKRCRRDPRTRKNAPTFVGSGASWCWRWKKKHGLVLPSKRLNNEKAGWLFFFRTFILRGPWLRIHKIRPFRKLIQQKRYPNPKLPKPQSPGCANASSASVTSSHEISKTT